MSLRALYSLLTRRFPPRGIPRTQAQVQAWAQSSPVTVSRAAIAGATTAAFAGLVGFLYFKKDTDESAASEVMAADTARKEVAAAADTRKEVAAEETRRKAPVIEAVSEYGDVADAAERATFMDEDGKMRWLDYIDYLSFGKLPGVKEATDQEDVKDEEVDDREVEETEQEEAAMEARFEEWMKKYGKTYRSEAEKAMRYRMFKKTAKLADKRNKSLQRNAFSPNALADEEFVESQSIPCDDSCWEEYVEFHKAVIALSKANGYEGVTYAQLMEYQGKAASHREATASDAREKFGSVKQSL